MILFASSSSAPHGIVELAVVAYPLLGNIG